MSRVYADRVRETTTTTGLGTDIKLNGAVVGYQTFLSGIGDGKQCYYAVAGGTQWIIVDGVYNSATNSLSRSSILASSNGGADVNLDAVTKDVWNDFPAALISLLTGFTAATGTGFYHATSSVMDGTVTAATGTGNVVMSASPSGTGVWSLTDCQVTEYKISPVSWIIHDVELTCTDVGDSGASRTIVHQTVGAGASIRSGEFHTLRNKEAGFNSSWVFEMGLHSERAVAWNSGTAYVVGNRAYVGGVNYTAIAPSTNHTPPNGTYWAQDGDHLSYNVGIYCISAHTGWMATGIRNDTGLLVAGEDGWYHGFYYADTNNALLCDINQYGSIILAGSISRAAPNTQTGATYAVVVTDTTIIANRAGTVTLTLPAAASFAGRELYVRTIQAQTVVSDASNVSVNGGAAGTAILAGTIGKWALLVSDATNWIIVANN